jgi:hypothetical protein
MEPSSGHPFPTVYALVAYIDGQLGDFLYRLRQEIVPTCKLRSHVSLLPPRPMMGPEAEAMEQVTVLAERTPAFTVTLGELRVFPVTNVIYLELSIGRGELVSIHDRLNSGVLGYAEPFEYHPHITLGQELSVEHFPEALRLCEQRWKEYTGPRSFPVETLTFVRNTGNCGWTDLGAVGMERQPALY